MAIERIVLATDSSLASEKAVAFVQNMVAQNTQVHIVSVVENFNTIFPMGPRISAVLNVARAEILHDAEDSLKYAKDLFEKIGTSVDTQVIDLSKKGGDIAHALIDVADALNADLLVVGARQHHGLLRWMEGTVSGHLAKHGHCAMLIVPAEYNQQTQGAPRRILFALDGSSVSIDALRIGVQMAVSETQLRAIYVVDHAVRLSDFVPIHLMEDAFLKEGEATLAKAAAIFATLPNPSETGLVDTAITNDDVPRTIVREAARWDADLVVMGTHGRRGAASWFIGSVANRVARIATIPLLLGREKTAKHADQ